MTISPKFWLIGYILIGFSYLKEKIATSGHLFHFYRNITTHCGQDMAKASYRSNLALSTHFGKFPKRSNMKPNILSKSFGKLQLGEQDWWEGTLIKLGDKDVSSTNGVCIDLVENANIHKHLHISDGICIFQIQMISSDIWEDLPSSEFAYGARSIPEMISVIK